MGITTEQYEDMVARCQKHGARPQQEEQEVCGGKAGHSKARMPEMVRPLHPVFRLSITIRYSDKRRRDLSGALATIEDCLIDAVKQLPDCLKEYLPQDDSWEWIREIHVFALFVPKGDEGAYIDIEEVV